MKRRSVSACKARPWHSVAYTASREQYLPGPGKYSRAVGVLVEKLLDPARYKKWNSNNGWTDGMRAGEHLAAGPVRYCSPRHRFQRI